MLRTLRSPLRSCLHRRFLSSTPPVHLPRPLDHRFRQLKQKPKFPPEAEASSIPEIPTFRQKVAETEEEPETEEEYEKYDQSKQPGVRKHLVFFLAGSALAFGVAARLTNTDTLWWSDKLARTGLLQRTPTDAELHRAREEQLFQRANLWLMRLRERLQNAPEGARDVVLYAYALAADSLLSSSEGKRACYAIVAVNGLVWAAWAAPRLQPFMRRHFLHHPMSGRAHTMLTSTFSHMSFFHLLFNSLALTSFGTTAAAYISYKQALDPMKLRESRADYHFLAFYVSAGVFAALVSHVASARVLWPRIAAARAALSVSKSPISSTIKSSLRISRTTETSSTSSAAELASTAIPDPVPGRILPSLGASGSVYAAVVVCALAVPDASIHMVLLPAFALPIGVGVGGMVALDLFGVLRGWTLFDHYAHLGGAAFGAMYYFFGVELWETVRHAAMWGLPPTLCSVSAWEWGL